MGQSAATNEATALILNFNQPIYGIGLNVGNPSGRFGYRYSLIEGDGSTFSGFTTTAGGYTLSFIIPRDQSLQMVALDTHFQKAFVKFLGDPQEFFTSLTFSNVRVPGASDTFSTLSSSSLSFSGRRWCIP